MDRKIKRRKVVKKITKFAGISACMTLACVGLYVSTTSLGVLTAESDKYEIVTTSQENFYDHDLAAEQLEFINILLDKNQDKIILGTPKEECYYKQKQKLFNFIPITTSHHLHYESIINEHEYEAATLKNGESEMIYHLNCVNNQDYQVDGNVFSNTAISEYMTNEELDKVLTNTMTTEDWQVIEDRLNTQWSSSKKLIKRTDLYKKTHQLR